MNQDTPYIMKYKIGQRGLSYFYSTYCDIASVIGPPRGPAQPFYAPLANVLVLPVVLPYRFARDLLRRCSGRRPTSFSEYYDRFRFYDLWEYYGRFAFTDNIIIP
jgi:hypothetical protein